PLPAFNAKEYWPLSLLESTYHPATVASVAKEMRLPGAGVALCDCTTRRNALQRDAAVWSMACGRGVAECDIRSAGCTAEACFAIESAAPSLLRRDIARGAHDPRELRIPVQ